MATNKDNKSSHGRKGDSRMHKAVAARLANPEISLFEALRIGGFDYPSNEDATAMDSENVTLGQRKNQLSRRLRLAKKSDTRVTDVDTGGAEAGNRAATAMQDTTGNGAALSLGAQRELQRMMLQWRPPQGTTAIGARALQMKRDHPGLGELLDEDENANPSQDLGEEEGTKRPRIAKFHPDFAPLFVPPASSFRSNTKNPGDASSVATNNSIGASPSIAAFTSGLTPSIGASGAASLSHPSLFSHHQLPNLFPGQLSQSRPSSVAVSSLAQTAQSVGMTLEQLAMTLSLNPTSLTKILAEESGQDAQKKKIDLAHRLFETECKALYSKCLLLAGVRAADCTPESQVYGDFVVKAWQQEGKRVKKTVGSSRGFSDMSVENLLGGDKSTSQSSVVTLRSNSHSHADHAADHAPEGQEEEEAQGDCGGRHLHRIDGQCGHKAIIHKPKNGNAHIDFVVGNQVECYHGIEPVGRNLEAAWPSRLSKGKDTDLHSELYRQIPEGSVPKVIELSDIDLQDPEWNYDVGGSIDGGVAGLFQLGAKPDEV